MAITRNRVKISLGIINNYMQEAEIAGTEQDRHYWLRQANAERNSLKRLVEIEKVLDELFGPEGNNGQAAKQA